MSPAETLRGLLLGFFINSGVLPLIEREALKEAYDKKKRNAGYYKNCRHVVH